MELGMELRMLDLIKEKDNESNRIKKPDERLYWRSLPKGMNI